MTRTQEEIEMFIDALGLRRFLEEIASVVVDKGIDIAHNWPDPDLGNIWVRAGNQIARCAKTKAIRRVP